MSKRASNEDCHQPKPTKRSFIAREQKKRLNNFKILNLKSLRKNIDLVSESMLSSSHQDSQNNQDTTTSSQSVDDFFQIDQNLLKEVFFFSFDLLKFKKFT